MECLIEDLECIEEYKQHSELVTGVTVGIGVIVTLAVVAAFIARVVLRLKAQREQAA